MSDLRTILNEGFADGQTLSSMYEIEDVLLLIDQVNHKVNYYKEMKKHRAASCDEKISALSDKAGALRSIVLNTMKKVAPNEKTLDFPDVGKVTRRKPRESIVIDQEDQVLDFLERKGLKDEVVKTVETVDRRKLKTVIQRCDQTGEKVPGISKVSGEESISITFEKPKDRSGDFDEPATTAEINLDALDSLV